MQTCRVVQSNLFRFAFIFLSCVFLVVSITGCERCSAESAIATVVKKAGFVDRSTEETDQNWGAADVGNIFEIGDAVRTRKASRAELSLDDGSILALDEETVIRFLDRKPGSKEQSLDLQLGSASLEAPKSGVTLQTIFGIARLEGGTKLQLQRSGNVLRYEVLVGAAELENAGGETLAVSAGQRVEVSLGEASLELLETIEEQKQPEEAVKAPEEEVATTTGPISAMVKGSRVEILVPGGNSFEKLKAGESTLEDGSTLKVGSGSSVMVTQGSDKAELSSGGTYVIGGKQLVTAKSGTITITADGLMQVAVPGGVIVTQKGSATITSGPNGTKVKANSGKVTIKGKTTETLSTGEQGLIENDGEVTVEGRGISTADYHLGPGQNVVIHDPTPPTAIRFLFDKKCDQGIIRLAGSKRSVPGDKTARGKKSVALLLGPGSVGYKLHCLDDDGRESPAVASGDVTILHDAGSRPMPKKAPSTTVDVNGRGYTVLYQNQLPKVTLRWSTAPPSASGFKLFVSGGGRSRTFSSGSPSYTFQSGALAGGTHTMYFTGGGRVSRKSTVSIHFDNATPTASLSMPVNSGVGPGGTVTVSGTALPGWSASVDGKTLGQDVNNRFSMKTNMPSDGRALAVRLTHPTRGSHVYLRRPTGAR